ncbi:MAG: maleylacetate reductase [Kiloniellales bacterium]
MMDFVYDALPGRVVFGVESLQSLPDEAARLGIENALVVCTPGGRRRMGKVTAGLGDRLAGVFDRVVMHVPAALAEAAREAARQLGADGCVAIGGGSAIGLAKAVALDSGLPILAVPTTYAGSEMTPILGMTEGRVKRTMRHARVLPKTVIYDPVLTLGLPPRISAASGLNAIAHSVEALYAKAANPITSMLAEEGIAALAEGLPVVVERPDDIDARSRALYGAFLCGAALGAVGMGIHHKLCHVLGGSFDLPHAETHAVLLPHTAAFNRQAAAVAMARVARALGAEDAPAGLWELAGRIGAPRALEPIGMAADDLDEAAEIATRDPYDNPRPVTREAVRMLLDDAYHGRRPKELANQTV